MGVAQMTSRVVRTTETEPDGEWIVQISSVSRNNTFCFEASVDGTRWVPINGRRVYGPGPQMGSIVSNAVAGGPAKFEGHANGFTFIRVLQTMSDGSKFNVDLWSTKPRLMYIIDEEMSIEDAFNS